MQVVLVENGMLGRNRIKPFVLLEIRAVTKGFRQGFVLSIKNPRAMYMLFCTMEYVASVGSRLL